MVVQVTVRYPSVTQAEIRKTAEIPEGCTSGELTSSVIKAFEQEEGLRFTGASILTHVNGKLTTAETLLRDGDDVKIITVAAGG